MTAAPGALAPEKLREGRVTTGTAGITPALPAQWFTAYVVLFSVNFACLATVAVAPPLELHESLSAWPERARTTRFCRPRRCRSPHDTSPSTAFRTTFTAMAIRPLLGAERALYTPNPNFGKEEYFCAQGLTGFSASCPAGKSMASCPHLHCRRPGESRDP